MGELMIVTGPPGAGKSTVCDLLAGRFESSVLITGDWFFGRWRQGAIAPWLPEAREQAAIAHEAAATTAGIFARADCQVVYDGFVPPRDLPAFAVTAGLAAVHYAVLLPSVTTCVERVTTRHGHGFTSADATRAMYQDFAGAALPDRHLITAAGQSPEAIADQVLDRFAAGRLLRSAPPG